MGYHDFIARKARHASERGLTVTPELAGHLFPFQASCVEHHLRAGAAGCFLDTGLGKTECQLEFCQQAMAATNLTPILWTPLAVAGQTRRRASSLPLQLDVIERALILWSNPSDVVLSPFMGIGSEGVMSLRHGRKFVGTELKESYWRQACRYLDAESRQPDAFRGAA